MILCIFFPRATRARFEDGDVTGVSFFFFFRVEKSAASKQKRRGSSSVVDAVSGRGQHRASRSPGFMYFFQRRVVAGVR